MNLLENDKLAKINGGGKSMWAILGGIGIFLAGLITGFFNPDKCN